MMLMLMASALGAALATEVPGIAEELAEAAGLKRLERAHLLKAMSSLAEALGPQVVMPPVQENRAESPGDACPNEQDVFGHGGHGFDDA